MILFCRKGKDFAHNLLFYPPYQTCCAMRKIALEGMLFHAYHGFYPEEQIIGNQYQVDVYLDTFLEKAHKDVRVPADDISTTVNYETIYNICKLEMKKPAKMIETVATSILSKIRGYYNDLEHPEEYRVSIKHIRVRVSKFNPPMGGKIARAYVEVEG